MRPSFPKAAPRSALLALSCALSLGVLAGCVAAPAPTPTPAPAPAPAPRPTMGPAPAPLSGHWMDAGQTAGDWRWQGTATASTATFINPGGQALLALRCDRGAQAVEITRYGGAGSTIDLRTETQDRLLPASGGNAATARVAAADPLLDAIAFSRGRFYVGTEGQPPLLVPSYPELTRVVEDCR